MRNEYQVLKQPLLSEKGTNLQEQNNQILFEVDRRATKLEIKKAVEKFFKVRVTNVRTMNFLGKKKVVGRRLGRKNHWKKAIVTLAEGQSVQLFEGV